jgi:hypothetical protein
MLTMCSFVAVAVVLFVLFVPICVGALPAMHCRQSRADLIGSGVRLDSSN